MKKILVMALVSIAALAVLGAGYAMWSDTLEVTGTVVTGDVDVAWSLHGSGDSEPIEKDVSSITCEIVDDLLVITILGAYPSIDYWCDIDVHSLGSVPVHLGPLVLTAAAGTPDIPGVITLPQWDGIQLHRGDEVQGRVNIHLYNEYMPEMNFQYQLTGGITAYQWNEY